MKILFLSSIFPHTTAPVRGTFNLEICRALAEEHEVKIVAPRSWTEVIRSIFSKQQTEADSETQNHNIEVTYPTYFYLPKFLRHMYGWFMWISVRRHLNKVIQEFSPEVIVSYWAHPDGEVGLRAANLACIPAAVIVGGSDVLVVTESPSRRPLIQKVLRESAAVFTVSEGLRQKVISLGTNSHQVHTVYQGTDVNTFTQGSQTVARQNLKLDLNRKMLVWVGRMVPIKGLDILINACSQLKNQGHDFQLNLVGDGPLRDELQRDVTQRGLTDVVHFAGSVKHSELADWYRSADATVMSSWSEGLPNVLRESLACGTPFVSTNVGSIEEIADEKYSQLVPPGNATQLATAIKNIFTGDFSQAAKQYQPESWNQAAANLYEILESLHHENVSYQSASVAEQSRQLETQLTNSI